MMKLISFVCLMMALALSPAAAKPQVLVDYGYSGYYSPGYVAPAAAAAYSPLAYTYPYAYTYSYPYAYY